MAFVSAAMKFTNDYLTDISLRNFHFIGVRYEPNLIFGRQLRELVAKYSGDFAKIAKNKRWLLIGYTRTGLEYTLKRADVYNAPITTPEDYEDYDGEYPEVLHSARWKRREVHTTFNYAFISPSPDLLEEVEEQVVVRDFGYSEFANAEVDVYDTDRSVKYTYPFKFLVNIMKFEIQNFEHIDDLNDGVFSIFSMKALVNFPVFTIDEVFDQYGKPIEKVSWTMRVHGYERNYEITNGVEEHNES